MRTHTQTHSLTHTHSHSHIRSHSHTPSHTHSHSHTHTHTQTAAICMFSAGREPPGLSPGLLLRRAWHGGAVPRSGEGWAGGRMASWGGGKGGAMAVKLRSAAWI